MCKKGGTAIIRPFIRAFFYLKNKGEIYMKNEKDYYLTTAITYTSENLILEILMKLF